MRDGYRFCRFSGIAFGICIAILQVKASAQACSDSFSVATLNPSWTFIEADSATGGSATLLNGKLVLSGKGRDIYNTTNQFVGVWRKDIPGDFDVSVRIESQDSTNDWAQAGIVMANDVLALGSGGYAAVDVARGASNGNTLFYDKNGSVGTLDTHTSVGTSKYPVWLRIAKTGTSVSAWYKNSESAAWTQIGAAVSPQTVNANSQIALFTTSHNVNATSKTTFDDFTCLGNTAVALAIPLRKLGAVESGLPVDVNGRWVSPRARWIPRFIFTPRF